jgi:hypothetical protein
LYAVNPHNGAALFKLDTGDRLASGALLHSNLLYLLGKDGTLLAFIDP